MVCEYCEQFEDDGHADLCPLTSILADPARAAAHPQVGVATSDWIDSALRLIEVDLPVTEDDTVETLTARRLARDRQILTDAFALQHRYVARITAAPLNKTIAALNTALNFV